jgi:hypothetical protein
VLRTAVNTSPYELVNGYHTVWQINNNNNNKLDIE